MRSALKAALIAVLSCQAGAALAVTDAQDFPQIERGRYLTVVGDCAACHTMSGGKDFAGGRPIETPFGAIVAPNITPDRDTGIGGMTDDEFVDALTKGTTRGGAHLYPAMPYTYMTKASRDDVLAIRAYLNTVPPVHNPVVSNRLPFPLDIRALMIGWDALFFKRAAFQPAADKSPEWNRGAYLVQGLAHCGMCHTPKNIMGGDRTSKALTGYSLQGWFAPNITNDARQGLGSWSSDDIVAYLKTGHNRVSAASGPMAEEVAQSSTHMTDADLHAIAVYLKDQPGKNDGAATPVSAQDSAMRVGGAIFRDECSACHTPDGKGVPSLFPMLNGSPAVQSREATSIIGVILHGARSVGTDTEPTAPAMPAFGRFLTDDQIAAVATYIRNAWGNAAPAVTAEQVKHMRGGLAEGKSP
jgi:mono/diheme cytochrome c family protein